jgi:hypothetical protein
MPRHSDPNILSEFIKSIRPPEDIRDKLDVGAIHDDDGIKIFERRPFVKDPEHVMYNAFAKLKYIKKSDTWRLYWMRGTLKWVLYEPFPESRDLGQLLKEVKRDAYGCFRG